MPRDYANGKIYSIRSLSQPDLVYIGSTTQTLAKRLGVHRSKFRIGKNKTTAVQILALGDSYIELIESFPCSNKSELERREGQIIRSTTCVNVKVAGRTRKEHYEDNVEVIAAARKDYYEQNKDKVLEYKKEYYKQNAEHIIEQKRDYYNANRETLLEQRKVYAAQHSTAISARRNEKISCDCGCLISRSNMLAHRQTAKHIAAIEAVPVSTEHTTEHADVAVVQS